MSDPGEVSQVLGPGRGVGPNGDPPPSAAAPAGTSRDPARAPGPRSRPRGAHVPVELWIRRMLVNGVPGHYVIAALAVAVDRPDVTAIEGAGMTHGGAYDGHLPPPRPAALY